MLYLVVHLTYVPGQERNGAAYERTVLSYFREHGGEVLGAFQPAPWADGTRASDEVQLLGIPSRAQLEAYLNDPRRLALAAERERTIANTELTMSESVIDYSA
jgi:hypothetical protein